MEADNVTIGNVVLGLLALFNLFNFIIGIWSRLRRHPPLDQELALYIKRAEAEIHFDKLYDLHRKLVNDISEFQSSISQQIGRIEGKISTLE